MTQFVTFGKQLQLQLEDPEDEGRKTSSVTAGYYQREGGTAVCEGRSLILKKPQNKSMAGSHCKASPNLQGEFDSRNGYSQPHCHLQLAQRAIACLLSGLPSRQITECKEA